MLNKFTISEKVIKRPNTKRNHFIPDPIAKEFWDKLYSDLRTIEQFQLPLHNSNITINPFFGFFGLRFHPITFQPKYFHIGIDIDQQIGQNVYPILEGIFEYSGYDKQNGNYVMISHPQIQTQDGFIMYSLYLHLDSTFVSFNVFEKIIRIAGLVKATNKKVKPDQAIGVSGDSGNSKNIFSHLHLQIEFRNKSKNKIILIDPAQVLGMPTKDNATINIESFDHFKEFYLEHQNELSNWSSLIIHHENFTTKHQQL